MAKVKETRSRYHKSVKGLKYIDIYKVLELYEVHSHAVGHAAKKVLMAGRRGNKDYKQDIQEAIVALYRELSMLDEKGKRQKK